MNSGYTPHLVVWTLSLVAVVILIATVADEIGPGKYIHTYIRTYVRTYVHTYIHTIHTYVRTYIHTKYSIIMCMIIQEPLIYNIL